MLNITAREAAISPAPPAGPRLLLRPDHHGPALLDGGWWPRSADSAAELPGLILGPDERRGRTIVRLRGALDFDAAPALRERLIDVLRRGAGLLVVDLSRVLSCDVSALAVLIGTQRRARPLGIMVRLAAPSLPVTKVLRSTGLNRSFTIYPDLSGALAATAVPCGAGLPRVPSRPVGNAAA